MLRELVIAGGGPAGMMAGLLFARAGVDTVVLEKHGDFLRDFRGDTVHPSTLELIDELGMLDAFLKRPHDEVQTLTAHVAGRPIIVADTSHLPVRCKFIALMPQWDFLDFLADAARTYPSFTLRMNAEVDDILMAKGRVAGVRLVGGEEIRAGLTIAADGRNSVLRDKAQLPRRDLGAPIDVLWFRIPKEAGTTNATGGTFGAGTLVVQLDRGDYWQCAYVVAKGSAEALRAEGIAAFRARVAAAVPSLVNALETLQSWDQVKLLSVSLDRLDQWYRPGLLAIGDAAHAMSPVGGVGINLAIQDAVAAANILARAIIMDEPTDDLLAKVQARRMFPTKVVQAAQKSIHHRLLEPLLAAKAPLVRPPLLLRLVDRFPVLRRIPARLIGLGIRREHIRSAEA